MIFIENRLENKIIEELSKGSLPSPILVSTLSHKYNVSEQGVYKALSFLIANEIVTKHKKIVSLNNFWIEKLKSFAHQVSDTYNANDFDDFLLLKDKEKITYHFQDTLKLDIHWMHIMLCILKRFRSHPLVIYNIHCWFMLQRPVAEVEFFNWLRDNNIMTFFLIGGKTKMDTLIKNKLQHPLMKIQLDADRSFSKDKYISVINDYIVYVSYGEEFNASIDTFFSTHSKIDQDTIDNFKKMLTSNTKSKIVIERNKSKAISLSKQMTKDHYVPIDMQKLIFN